MLIRATARPRAHGWPVRAIPVAAFALALISIAVGGPARAGGGADAARPGAYCPLPAPGQRPACLVPAQAEYGDFFAAIERGQVTRADAATIEADLTGRAGRERAYLALSSLSYGYWQLAERIGSGPEADPALVERLSDWNAVLVDLYADPDHDDEFRAAVRQAASDLRQRAPRTRGSCRHGYPGACEHTDELVRALAEVDGRAGVRSPLAHLLERLVGAGDDDDVAPPAGDSR